MAVLFKSIDTGGAQRGLVYLALYFTSVFILHQRSVIVLNDELHIFVCSGTIKLQLFS